MSESSPVAEIQARALAAAAAVVERMLDATGVMASPAGNRSRELRRLRADAERLAESYFEAARLVLDGLFELFDQTMGSAVPDVLVVGPVAVGSTAAATVWLHVLDTPNAERAKLHAPGFIRHDGVQAAVVVTFDPSEVDTSAAGARQPVTVTVDVLDATEPGTYHGMVLAAGLAEVVLPVRLEVERAGPW